MKGGDSASVGIEIDEEIHQEIEKSDPKLPAWSSNAPCPHLSKGISVDFLSSNISKISITQCSECTKKDSKKGILKQLKKITHLMDGAAIPGVADPKTWVCLGCGHAGCGSLTPEEGKKGVDEEGKKGAAKGPSQGHTWQHSLYSHHPIALLCGEKLSYCWCFMCKSFLEFGFISSKDGLVMVGPSASPALLSAIKLVQDKLVKESGKFEELDLDNAVVERGIVSDEAEAEAEEEEEEEVERICRVKGLVNLGNTCFMNSVLQNLLAIRILREHFLMQGPDSSVTSCLRKLFLDTSPKQEDAGSKKKGKGYRGNSKGIANPGPLFAAIGDRVPRFRGFQQQDSHELLRCLLECLKADELQASKPQSKLLSAKRMFEGKDGNSAKSKEQKSSSNGNGACDFETFVDKVFQSEVSSTITCCDCRHSSVVFESYLDLSLPIPSRPNHQKSMASLEVSIVSANSGKKQESESKEIRNEDDAGSRGNGDRQSSSDDVAMENESEKSSQESIQGANGDLAARPLDQTNGECEAYHQESDPTRIIKRNNHLTDTELSVELDSLPKKSCFQDSSPKVIREESGLRNDCKETDEQVLNDGDACSSVLEMKKDVSTQDCRLSTDERLLLDQAEKVQKPNLEKGKDRRKVQPQEEGFLPMTLDGCLTVFTRPEILCNDNAWKCEGCFSKSSESSSKTENDSSKQKTEKSNLQKQAVGQTVNGAESCSEEESVTVDKEIKSTSDDNTNNPPKEKPKAKSSSMFRHLDGGDVYGFILSSLRERKTKEIEEKKSKKSQDGTTRNATKMLRISKAPPVLTIHLKRFTMDSIGRLRKLSDHVDFQEKLDLRPYLDSRCQDKDNCLYKLIGIVEHSGTMGCGHYVAYVRVSRCDGSQKADSDNPAAEDKWYRISDTFVREVTFSEVLQSEAYLLFYEKDLRG